MMKYVFVTGGVVSSLGKGTTAASLGRLLKARGYKVAMQKCDTYYNFNPALLSPLQHGENFITEDGVAADLDLGHYERFIDESLKGEASITTGKIHTALVERELRGEYHGATITVVPHVTNEIKHRIITAAETQKPSRSPSPVPTMGAALNAASTTNQTMPPSRIVPMARPKERRSMPANRAPHSRKAAERNPHASKSAAASAIAARIGMAGFIGAPP